MIQTQKQHDPRSETAIRKPAFSVWTDSYETSETQTSEAGTSEAVLDSRLAANFPRSLLMSATTNPVTILHPGSRSSTSLLHHA